ncbi:MAG: hypothetical protein WD845_09310 [Pirellulales bacterium]
MEQKSRVQLHESCVVPYRETERGIEFCLVSKASANRWEFPHAQTDDPAGQQQLLLNQAADGAGLRGHLDAGGPFDAFVASRGNESRSVSAYLMRVTRTEDVWPKQDSQRRLWCLAEEARARLRRKPLRRFIDLALRMVGPGRDAALPGDSEVPQKPR